MLISLIRQQQFFMPSLKPSVVSSHRWNFERSKQEIIHELLMHRPHSAAPTEAKTSSSHNTICRLQIQESIRPTTAIKQDVSICHLNQYVRKTNCKNYIYRNETCNSHLQLQTHKQSPKQTNEEDGKHQTTAFSDSSIIALNKYLKNGKSPINQPNRNDNSQNMSIKSNVPPSNLAIGTAVIKQFQMPEPKVQQPKKIRVDLNSRIRSKKKSNPPTPRDHGSFSQAQSDKQQQHLSQEQISKPQSALKMVPEITIDLQHIKEDLSDFKSVFAIRDQQKFQEQLTSMQKKYTEANNAARTNTRNVTPAVEESESVPTSELQRIEEFDELVDDQQSQRDEGSQPSVLSLLKNKIDQIQQKAPSEQPSDNKVQAIASPTSSLHQSQAAKQPQAKSIHHTKQQESQSSASSISFFRDREALSTEGVHRMNIIVSEMVKQVNAQLIKVEGQNERESLNESSTPPCEFIETSLKKLTSNQPLSQEEIERVFAKQQLEGDQYASNPSTIQKASQHSDNKSEVIQQLEELRQYTDSANSNLFNKPLEGDSLVLPEYASSGTSHNRQKPKEIVIDLQDMKAMTLSQGDFSLSQLPSEHQSSHSVPSTNSFRIQTATKTKDQDLPVIEPDEVDFHRNNTVQHISINLDPLDHNDEDYSELSFDADDLNSYDSDSDASSKHKTSHKKTVLAPVIEEDLEESQACLGQNSKFSNKTVNRNTKEEEMKQLEQEFLKDLIIQHTECQLTSRELYKKESEVQSYHSFSQSSLMAQIKSNIDNLRNKIASQIARQGSSSSSRNYTIKSIDIDLSSSILKSLKPSQSLVQSGEPQKSIDFDQINQEAEALQLYKSFKSDITRLKRKMQEQVQASFS